VKEILADIPVQDFKYCFEKMAEALGTLQRIGGRLF
jgi:hypothetical protein